MGEKDISRLTRDVAPAAPATVSAAAPEVPLAPASAAAASQFFNADMISTISLRLSGVKEKPKRDLSRTYRGKYVLDVRYGRRGGEEGGEGEEEREKKGRSRRRRMERR